jgi:hypothetical protein
MCSKVTEFEIKFMSILIIIMQSRNLLIAWFLLIQYFLITRNAISIRWDFRSQDILHAAINQINFYLLSKYFQKKKIIFCGCCAKEH